MGLLTVLRKQRLKDREIRVLMLGLDNAGKTTIVDSIAGRDIYKVSPTLGFNIMTIDYSGCKLNIWDIGGQASLRPFWRNYFEKTEFLVWVVDISALDRLDDCRIELHKALNEDRLLGAGLLVWVNKLDSIAGSDESKQELVENVARQLQLDTIDHHNWKVLGCSAYTGYNLDRGMDWIVAEVKSRLYLLD